LDTVLADIFAAFCERIGILGNIASAEQWSSAWRDRSARSHRPTVLPRRNRSPAWVQSVTSPWWFYGRKLPLKGGLAIFPYTENH